MDDMLGVKNGPDQHAHLMVGKHTLFLCHLTMFHMEDHCYQIVLRARLPEYAMKQYVKDREDHPHELYFLGNVADDLLTMPEIQTGSRASFVAEIYRGIPYKKEYTEWPWKDVKPIIDRVPLTIERVVHYRHFDFSAAYPQALTYLLFGYGDEAHLSHFQTKEPDFDHVASLADLPAWLPPQSLEAGVTVNLPDIPGDRVFCESPLPSTSFEVTYAGQNGQYGSEKRRYPLRVGGPEWFSTKIVNMKNPCPA